MDRKSDSPHSDGGAYSSLVPPPSSLPKPILRRVRKLFWTPRRYVQLGFVLLNIWLCTEFYLFVLAAQLTSDGPLPSRPPGAEGWLPISGLMGAIDWLASGSLNPVHPAATVLFLTFLAISFLVRKAFCGWLCPIGTLSDGLAKLGRWLFMRNFLLPRWLDFPLLGLKYLILGFFLWAFYMMGAAGISSFIQSPYNQVADVKMLLFFVQLGTLGAVVLLLLTLLSIFVQGFWCRYLCPYGALLGLFSWLSPIKVRRDPASCIDCGKCAKVCPSRLPVDTKLAIISVECTGCMQCVEACPVVDCLHMGTPRWKPAPKQVAIIVAAVFIIFVITAQLSGVWQSNLTDEAYRYHIQRLGNPEYGHPGQ
ncbi:4Fe-4S binding protein [candidate division KSB1 bacterium]|nr:4Fe-4S binding protein [candidate division KSB1 bacterium]